EVEVGALPACHVDPRLVRQALVNLFSNALKFTRTSRPARIEIGTRVIDGEEMICVADNGVGFDQKHADEIFKVFSRLHGQDYEGTGVGLAIVEQVVRRHGGKLVVSSRENEGTCFCLTLWEAGQSGITDEGERIED
ncbi:hypothetical protein JW921_10470, partial [Candidatus Fermentibacterales bacterium]|nr:hypothetical protein [Candidatus Fermentibacterales bacterium]